MRRSPRAALSPADVTPAKFESDIVRPHGTRAPDGLCRLAEPQPGGERRPLPDRSLRAGLLLRSRPLPGTARPPRREAESQTRVPRGPGSLTRGCMAVASLSPPLCSLQCQSPFSFSNEVSSELGVRVLLLGFEAKSPSDAERRGPRRCRDGGDSWLSRVGVRMGGQASAERRGERRAASDSGSPRGSPLLSGAGDAGARALLWPPRSESALPRATRAGPSPPGAAGWRNRHLVTDFGISVTRRVKRHDWLAHVAPVLKIKPTLPSVLANANSPPGFPHL